MKKRARSSVSYVRAKVLDERGALPIYKNGAWCFEDQIAKKFKPNLSPVEVLEAGSFGGSYFRPIYSRVLDKNLSDQHSEFDEHFGHIDESLLTSDKYDNSKNKFKVKSGGDLEMWEGKGWMSELDPYGWFQWYCRFFYGRRSSDDERQIGRWLRCAGETGRWRNNLIKKVWNANKTYIDASVSPVVRQTLQHWAYSLTEKHYRSRVKQLSKK